MSVLNKKKIIVIVTLVILCIIAGIVGFFFIQKTKQTEVKEPVVQENKLDIQSEINDYQKRYFEIVKRHNALLTLTNDSEAVKDLKELKTLFQEVKKKIDKDNEFLEQYEKINNQYKINTGKTTVEINDFAKQKYDAFDKLLNDTYKAVKSNITEEEFEQLKLSQRDWLKEVEDYNNVFVAQGFGTIGSLVKLDYETNMRCFRTLLLMLYLKNDISEIELKDYIGNWDEIVAGRIYVEIKNKKDKIQVKYGGANSAYSHSESIYDCRFDSGSKDLICDSAKHTDQFVSCKGISSNEDMEGFLKCIEENPKSEKDDYKKYSDKKIRTIKIKTGTKSHHIIDENEFLSKERKAELKKNYENIGLYFAEDKDTVYYKQK